MFTSYGYIRGMDGNDGEETDCYLGDHLDSKRVFVIDQKDSKGGEKKLMLGFKTPEEAKIAYLAHMKPGNFGGMCETTIEDLKTKVSKKPSSLPKGEVAGEEGRKYIVKPE